MDVIRNMKTLIIRINARNQYKIKHMNMTLYEPILKLDVPKESMRLKISY
jgi:hypothetical protein